jgi:hypothetical protein
LLCISFVHQEFSGYYSKLSQIERGYSTFTSPWRTLHHKKLYRFRIEEELEKLQPQIEEV